ncbi:MAG: cryptochrome/photolyase family protein [Pseudomonadota bacterium]
MADDTSEPALILILGDQLSKGLSSLRAGNPATDRILMVEVHDEATYVRHHKKKIAFLFAAMRHFADGLRDDGWAVTYVTLDDEKNTGSFTGELERAVRAHTPSRIVVTEPGEWRVLELLRTMQDESDVPLEILDDDRFIASHAMFDDWARDRKTLRMEYFYRMMRQHTGLLMTDDNEPEGGQWNYDHDNRKPPKEGLDYRDPPRFEPDDITSDVLALVNQRFDNHFGTLEPFWFAVTQSQANDALEHFITHGLPRFGDYQDAMVEDEAFLFHSLLGLYINAGLLDPLTVCKRAADAYANNAAPLNAVEGFIRQIIGWREYIRGIYWQQMPGYTEQNFFGAKRKLPDFYWTGETKMTCVAQAVQMTAENAYAHHIQRLMVTGTFAQIAGIDPHDVHEWYLAVYADAYEWVEAPNVIGMSQFADGGLLASKPYAASGNYINKMSDYCKGCAYSVTKKTEDNSCPFNSLYWDFLDRNAEKLAKNPRMGQMYATWNRMKDDKKQAYRDRAKDVLELMEVGAL